MDHNLPFINNFLLFIEILHYGLINRRLLPNTTITLLQQHSNLSLQLIKVLIIQLLQPWHLYPTQLHNNACILYTNSRIRQMINILHNQIQPFITLCITIIPRPHDLTVPPFEGRIRKSERMYRLPLAFLREVLVSLSGY